MTMDADIWLTIIDVAALCFLAVILVCGIYYAKCLKAEYAKEEARIRKQLEEEMTEYVYK